MYFCIKEPKQDGLKFGTDVNYSKLPYATILNYHMHQAHIYIVRILAKVAPVIPHLDLLFNLSTEHPQ